MKDYHDVILMSREPNLIDTEKLRKDISQTFAQRGTLLKIPVSFDPDGILTLQKLWTQHLRGLGESGAKLNLPKQMSDVLNEMNAWIAKLLRT